MRYQEFTRWREARFTGADWEWWFLFPDGSCGMRVQAKEITFAGDNYGGLAYANKHGFQVDLLRQDAAASNLLPMYALYCVTPAGPSSRCCGHTHAELDEAAFLASADLLHAKYIAAVRSRVTRADLRNSCVPLSCFFCCPLHKRVDGFRTFLEDIL